MNGVCEDVGGTHALTIMRMVNKITTRTRTTPPTHIDMKIGKPKGTVNLGSVELSVGNGGDNGDDDGGSGEALEDVGV